MIVGRTRLYHRLILLICLLSPLVCSAEERTPSPTPAADFESVSNGCDLQFPRDHGAHPGFQTEWWYYTGNLRGEGGERYGFQITFFRRQIAPLAEQEKWPDPVSTWRTLQVYFAHTALSNMATGKFHHGEKISRGAADLAGVRQGPSETLIFLEDWSARITPSGHELKSQAQSFSIQLNLKPLKEPVLHGESGYSLKGSTPDKASCYYSLTRMEALGIVTLGNRDLPVAGTAWMDHEFSSAPIESIYVGWDWFSLQFTDNTELMIYLLRKKDGSFGTPSSGTFVDAAGRGFHLGSDEFSVQALDFWKSPHTGATYPSRWKLHVHPIQMDLTVEANLADQELRTGGSTQITYWEGSVSATGAVSGKPVASVGYVELTGYAHPIEALH